MQWLVIIAIVFLTGWGGRSYGGNRYNSKQIQEMLIPSPSPSPTPSPSPSPSPTPSPSPSPSPSPTPPGCFLAGTKILMAGGMKKDIEDLRPGEKVKSFNEETQELEDSTILANHTHWRDGYFIINDEIRVTGEHPFYLSGSWVEAKDLSVGDILLSEDGRLVAVESIEYVVDDVEVYNITVEDNENYFADGVLVHNKPTPPPDIG